MQTTEHVHYLDAPTNLAPVRLLLTPQEAAAALGIHRATLYELIRSGEIASISIGRARRIAVTTLEAWIARKLDIPTPSINASTVSGLKAKRKKGAKQDGEVVVKGAGL